MDGFLLLITDSLMNEWMDGWISFMFAVLTPTVVNHLLSLRFNVFFMVFRFEHPTSVTSG